MSVPALTRRIKEVETPQELFEIITLHGGTFDEIHASASLMQLAKMKKLFTHDVAKSATFGDLLAFLEYQVGVMEPRALGNTVWSLAQLDQKIKIAATPLMAACAERAKSTMKQFRGPDLDNLVWAVAQLRYKDAALMRMVARQTCQICFTLDQRATISVAWGFAEMKIYDKELMEALAQKAVKNINQWSLQDMATLASSFTRLNQTHEGLTRAMTKTLVEQSWKDQSGGAWLNRARILLASTRAGTVGADFVDRIEQRLRRKVLRGSTAYVTAAMLWACRKLGCKNSHPKLLHMLQDIASGLKIIRPDMDRADFLDAVEWNAWFSEEYAKRRGVWVPKGTAGALQ